MEYAIIRNEWGTNWGLDGYAYVYLDPASTTGVCSLYADNYLTTVGF
jgi:C1A family cysteine protease